MSPIISFPHLFFPFLACTCTCTSQGIEDPNPPPYVFESVLRTKSPLLDIMAEPALVEPRITEIETRTMQFYLGPAESGAPMHFHRGAWNVLVHGRKRWFLLPPPAALYSIKHPRDWLDEVRSGMGDGVLNFQLPVVCWTSTSYTPASLPRTIRSSKLRVR